MDKLAEIKVKLAQAAHKDKVEDSDKIRELGLDSLDVVELLLQLEEEYDVHFDDVDMGKLATVKDLLDEIAKQL
jgi:acyl carrier protein